MNKKITILHTESSRQWGGQEQRILLEAIGLKKRGYRIIIACRADSRLLPRAQEQGIETRVVDMKSSFGPYVQLQLFKLIRREKIDIVNTHSSKDSWLISPVARYFTAAKVIRTRHVSIPIPKHPLNIVYRFPQAIITCGETIKKAMIKENKLSPEKIISIPTGVDLKRFNPMVGGEKVREEWGVGPKVSLVGALGIIRSEKGHNYFVEAAVELLQDFPELKFVIIGNEPKGDTLMQQIKKLGLEEKVIIAGLREDIPECLAALDIFVSPSLREGVPQGVAQALAMEKPVVASEVGGVGELVQNEKTGLLVPPADSIALARAIRELLEDKVRARAFGKRGRELIEENFCSGVMLDKTEALYKDLLEKGKT